MFLPELVSGGSTREFGNSPLSALLPVAVNLLWKSCARNGFLSGSSIASPCRVPICEISIRVASSRPQSTVVGLLFDARNNSRTHVTKR